MAVVDDIALVRVEVDWSARASHPRGNVEHVVVPLERREARPAAEPLALRVASVDFDVDPADLRGLRSCVTRAPSACASSCPPRQWPITGTPSRDGVAQQLRQRLDPRQRVVDAHRAAHHADAGERARIVGHRRRPRRSRSAATAATARVEPFGEMRGAFGGREAEDRDRAHGTAGCGAAGARRYNRRILPAVELRRRRCDLAASASLLFAAALRRGVRRPSARTRCAPNANLKADGMPPIPADARRQGCAVHRVQAGDGRRAGIRSKRELVVATPRRQHDAAASRCAPGGDAHATDRFRRAGAVRRAGGRRRRTC